MIKDRGNIKWTSLMLTEHRKKLEEIFDRRGDIDKPILDEQHQEELNYKVKEAIEKNNAVKVIYYENKRLHQVEGIIKINKDYVIIKNK
ncbi:MAG: YolD-like family protein, partial [bacterium]